MTDKYEFSNSNFVTPVFHELGLPGSHENVNAELMALLFKALKFEGISLLPEELSFYLFLLEKKLEESKEIRLCEHGSGSSTLYLKAFLNMPRKFEYKARIVSFETDVLWFGAVTKLLDQFIGAKTPVVLNYYKSPWIETLSAVNEKFNVVMIDGRKRLEFIKAITSFLDDDSLIFLHDYTPNASRDEEFNFLKENYNLVSVVSTLACFESKKCLK